MSSSSPPSAIVKEGSSGRVETIDPLHPTSTAQLGRSLHEVSSSDKSNDVGPPPLPQTSDALDVPPTSASTSLLVDGGKTEDPRHVSPQLEVDPTQADARTQAMEAEARGEAERLRESHKVGGATEGVGGCGGDCGEGEGQSLGADREERGGSDEGEAGDGTQSKIPTNRSVKGGRRGGEREGRGGGEREVLVIH